jgi:hypothetical protein
MVVLSTSVLAELEEQGRLGAVIIHKAKVSISTGRPTFPTASWRSDGRRLATSAPMMGATGRQAGKKRWRVGKPADWRDLRVPGSVGAFRRPAVAGSSPMLGRLGDSWGRSGGGWGSQPQVKVHSDEF